MRFWFWIGILAGLVTMDAGREWRQPHIPAATKSGPTPVMEDPDPRPTPRP